MTGDRRRAWRAAGSWGRPLVAAPSWVPSPTADHATIFGNLVRKYDVRGNLVADADLAALALGHGLEVCSADSDFARFREVRWVNPL